MRRDELVDLVTPVVEEEGFELVECSVSRTTKSQTFRVSVDGQDGVSIDACSRVSRRIAVLLDANPLLHGAYQLEVSSAGMNRPIWKREHFERFAGEPVRIEMADPAAQPRVLQGTIGGIEDGRIWILRSNGERQVIPLEAIARASLRMDPWRKRPEGHPGSGH